MRYLLAILCLGLFGGVALAEEPILNAPSPAMKTFTKTINTLNPSGDEIVDVLHGNEAITGTSAALYSFEKWSNPVVNKVDIRVGYGGDRIGYATLSLALDRITKVENLKYVHAGWVGGYNGGEQHFVSGPVIGVKAEF